MDALIGFFAVKRFFIVGLHQRFLLGVRSVMRLQSGSQEMGRRRVLEVQTRRTKLFIEPSFTDLPLHVCRVGPSAIEMASITRATTDPADRMPTCISSRPPELFLTLNRFVYVDEQ